MQDRKQRTARAIANLLKNSYEKLNIPVVVVPKMSIQERLDFVLIIYNNNSNGIIL